jgi:hypothetical protein
MREPRLIEADQHHGGKSVKQVVYKNSDEVESRNSFLWATLPTPGSGQPLLDLSYPAECLRQRASR